MYWMVVVSFCFVTWMFGLRLRFDTGFAFVFVSLFCLLFCVVALLFGWLCLVCLHVLV